MDDIKSLVTRFYDSWNEHDRDGWLACYSEDVTFSGPGGIAGKASTPGECSGLFGRTLLRILRTGSPIQELLSLAGNWGETMAEHPNVARIGHAYAAFAKGDFAVLEDFFAEDLLWYEGGRTQLAGEHGERRPCSETST